MADAPLPHEKRYLRALDQIARAHCTLREPSARALRQMIAVLPHGRHDMERDKTHPAQAWALARQALAPLVEGLCADVFPRMVKERAHKDDRAHLFVQACKRLRDARVILETPDVSLRRAVGALARRVLKGKKVTAIDEKLGAICLVANVTLRVLYECSNDNASYAVDIIEWVFGKVFDGIAEAKGVEKDPVDLLNEFSGAAADYERNARAQDLETSESLARKRAAAASKARAAPESGSDTDSDKAPPAAAAAATSPLRSKRPASPDLVEEARGASKCVSPAKERVSRVVKGKAVSMPAVVVPTPRRLVRRSATDKPARFVTDANGVRARVIEEGDAVPKLAVVFIIED